MIRYIKESRGYKEQKYIVEIARGDIDDLPGMKVFVYSSNESSEDKKYHDPPHCHIKNEDKNYEAQVSLVDLRFLGYKYQRNKEKGFEGSDMKDFLDWLDKKSIIAKRNGADVTNLQLLRGLWDSLVPDNMGNW